MNLILVPGWLAVRAEQPPDAATRGLSLLQPEPPLHIHGRKRESQCPVSTLSPPPCLCPALPGEGSHFRSKIPATLQAHGALPAPPPAGEGESSVCSQLSALLRCQAILFAARVSLRLDRRFWSCLWAQHWPYAGFSREIRLGTGAEHRAVPTTLSCFICVNMMLVFTRLI